MMDTEQAELEIAHQEAVQDIPDELETQKLERLAQTFFENCQANLAWLDNPPEDKEGWQRAMDMRREIVETLIEEIIIDPERETMRLKGVFDGVVQFNIEKGEQSYLDLSARVRADLFHFELTTSYGAEAVTV
jgi:hypothetical protein